ncbi:MAG TPA: AAA domain-containing protein [Chitinophagaceae bacterium]|nr:AAA domain-containing protein [Chitinophagaceae bacterium]
MHPDIQRLLTCIDLEEKEQLIRYRLDQAHSLKQLKAEGLALHPLVVTRRSFGYADYPEVSFRLPYPAELSQFRDGVPIECFVAGEEPVKGVLLALDGRQGEFRLFAPDFPDWIEDDGVGIKLAPDTHTTAIMRKALGELEKNPPVYRLFEQLHGQSGFAEPAAGHTPKTGQPHVVWQNPDLNTSQREAVLAVLGDEPLCVLHGPPGTGKTTTLVEAILQLIRRGEKILVTAPSNTAVDNLCRSLLRQGVNLLRVGNTSRVDPEVFAHTPEGKLRNSKAIQQIKQLKIRAEAFRRMALKYKRQFGKAEREQRNLLLAEVRQIRQDIKRLQSGQEEELLEKAQVVAGTPVGLYEATIRHHSFSTLVMDEAGQCLEPLAWCVIPLAEKWVLAGDPWQLPPTVLSQQAVQLGFARSVLELAMDQGIGGHFLDTQYRMRPAIAAFSSQYFYGGRLQSAAYLDDRETPLVFFDTAGSGYAEEQGPDGISLQNPGELDVVRRVLDTDTVGTGPVALISPYAGQVGAAGAVLPGGIRISTIDSFQGQEMDTVIVSLVRSNEEGNIGFLKDYRRMNVALTRAREKLIVIGDSATIGQDPFFRAFLEYAEKAGGYRSVWELLV